MNYEIIEVTSIEDSGEMCYETVQQCRDVFRCREWIQEKFMSGQSGTWLIVLNDAKTGNYDTLSTIQVQHGGQIVNHKISEI